MGVKKRFLLLSYRFVGKRFPTLFLDLKKSMAKAGMRVSFRSYVGVLSITSIVVGVGMFGLLFNILPLFVSASLYPLVLLSSGLGILCSVSTIVVFYVYPSIKASSIANQIDANIPHIANYMSILASAGVTPEKIFHSLARSGKDLRIEREARMIIRDIDLLGEDLFAALHNASEKSPSKEFSGLLEGIIASSHAGGDLSSYLRGLSKRYMQKKGTELRRFLDNLGAVAEIYVTFMVAAPLLLVVMLSVLTFLGGGIGGISPEFLLFFMAYVMLPVGVFFILTILDSMIPPG
jgi:flagellar protein FlaJ